MKRFYPIFFFILLCPILYAQMYGNEWITNYNNKYYKIKVINDGIYRVDSATLVKAGIPVSSIRHTNYHLFFRGVEQYIYVQLQSNKALQYIEFFGQHNDGFSDSLCYAIYGISFLPNPYYSLFNDTSTYYLTWDATPGKRIMQQANYNFGNYTASPYIIDTAVVAQNALFYEGARQYSGAYSATDPRYKQSEGWFSPLLTNGNTFTYYPHVSNIYTGPAPNVFFRTVIEGANIPIKANDHEVNILYSNSSNGYSTLWNTLFTGFRCIDTTTSISANLLSSSNFNVQFQSITQSGIDSCSTGISYIYISYPRQLNLGGASSMMMWAPDGSNNYAFLNFSNFSVNAGDTAMMYDLTNHNRFYMQYNTPTWDVLVPNSGGNKQCYLTTYSQVNTVKTLIPAGSNGNGIFTNYTNVATQNAYLMVYHPSLESSVLNSYAPYRASSGFHPVTANVEELYDEFAYGIEKDPLAIRNFCNYTLTNWKPNPPQYLFLIGKGIHEPEYRRVDSCYRACLVPSFGYPSSDILFTSGLVKGANKLQPAIATGRLAAVDDAEVLNYLSKTQTFESATHAQWMKHVLHFAGGDNYAETNVFLTFLQQYQQIIQDTLFGARVYTFNKATSQPLVLTLADSIINLINEGASILTFFGHANGGNFDESLDYPSDYNNIGKYPLIIANACFSGDIYQPVGIGNPSTSEQFVLYPNGGSIAFLASDYLGIPSESFTYTNTLYMDIASQMYRQPLSKCIQNTIGRMSITDSNMIITSLEMTYHGDPVIRLNYMDSLPDYLVNDSSIFFTPATVTSDMNTFTAHLVVSNIGEAKNQLVEAELTREYPNDSITNPPYFASFKNLYYQDTFSIKLPVNQIIGVGLNFFSASVNQGQQFIQADKELTYVNNSIISIPLWIGGGDITPVWPYNFAIIPVDSVTLKGSTGDPFAAAHNYIFEMDTSGLFNSPWLKYQVVNHTGGVVCAYPENWRDTAIKGMVRKPEQNKKNGNTLTLAGGNEATIIAAGKLNKVSQSKATAMGVNNNTTKKTATTVNTSKMSSNSHYSHIEIERANTHRVKTGPFLQFKDTTVYYWRVRRDTSDYKDYPWEESSFEYIKNKNGWGQSHFYQFDDDNYSFINDNIPLRDWTFSTAGRTLECNTSGMLLSNINADSLWNTEFKLDGYVIAYAGCQYIPGIYMAVINPTTLAPWSTTNHSLFALNGTEAQSKSNGCNSYPDNKFIYWFNQFGNNISSLTNALTKTDSIPNGYYILLYTWIDGYFSMIPPADTGAFYSALVNLGATQIRNYKNDTVPFIIFAVKGRPLKTLQFYGTKDSSSVHLTTVLPSSGTFGSIISPMIGPALKWDSIAWLQRPPVKNAQDSVKLNVIGIDPNGNSHTLLTGIPPSTASIEIASYNPKYYPFLQLMLYTKDAIDRLPAQLRKWQVYYSPVPEVAINPSIYTYYHADSLNIGDTVKFKTVAQNISDWTIDTMAVNTYITDPHDNTNLIKPTLYTKDLGPGDTVLLSYFVPTGFNNIGNNSIWFEINPFPPFKHQVEQFHGNNYAKKNFDVIGDKLNPLLDVTFDGVQIFNDDIISAHPNILMKLTDESKFLALNDTSKWQVFIRNVNNPEPTRVYFGPNYQYMTFTPAVLPNNSCKVLYAPTLQSGTYELTVNAANRSNILSSANSYIVDFEVNTVPTITNVINYPNPFSTSTRFVFTLTGEQVPTYFKIQIITITGKVVREITESELGTLHIGRNLTQYAWDGTDKYGAKLAPGIYLYKTVTSLDGQIMEHASTSIDQYFSKQGWGKMCIIR